MKTQATAATAAPSNSLVLSLLRRRIMERMANEVFTPAERLRANHNVYSCEDAARLHLWYKNVSRVELEREVAQAQTAADAPAYATTYQKEEVVRLLNNPTITRREKTKVLLGINRLTATQADEVVTALVQAIWERDKGEAAYLSQMTDLLSRVGIAHQQLLTA